jgi:hypothetical protein
MGQAFGQRKGLSLFLLIFETSYLNKNIASYLVVTCYISHL